MSASLPMNRSSILSPLPAAHAGAAVHADQASASGPSAPAAGSVAVVRRPSQRESVLDAAEAVVLANGAAHLTLDAVAERAGLSKGGLLYHFPTKELLLQAMVDRHMHRIDQNLLRGFERLPPGPGRELKARVLMAADRFLDAERRLGSATLAATANNPRLLDPIRASHRRRLEWLRGGDSANLPFDRAAAIALAVDGLCLLEVLQISPYDDAQRQSIIDSLLRLVDETAARAHESWNPDI